MKTIIAALCFVLSFNLFAESIIDTIKKINNSTVAQKKITEAALESWKDFNKELMFAKGYDSCDLTMTDISWSPANNRFNKSIPGDFLMAILMPGTSGTLMNDLIGVFIHDDTIFLDMGIHNECRRTNTGRLMGPVDELLSVNCSIEVSEYAKVISINDCTVEVHSVTPFGVPYSKPLEVKFKTVLIPYVF